MVWAYKANSTHYAQIAPLVIEHVKRQTPLALTLIRQAAREIDRLGAALASCSLLDGPWRRSSNLAGGKEPLRGATGELGDRCGPRHAADDPQNQTGSVIDRNRQEVKDPWRRPSFG